MPDQARASHAVGVADRDAAAVDVVDLGVDTQLVAAIQGLAGEGLVQLPQTDVLYAQAVLPEQFGHGIHRANTHLLGCATRNRHAAVDAHSLQAALLRQTGFHDHTGTGPVGQLAGVAGRDRSAFDDRLEGPQALQCGVGPVPFVAGQRHLAVADGTAGLVGHRHAGSKRHDLQVEAAGLLGCRRALLRLQRIQVLRLAADGVFLGHKLGRHEHRHIGSRCPALQIRVLGRHRAVEVGLLLGRNVFVPAGHHDLHAIHHHLLGSGGDGHQAGRTLPVHGLARCRNRQSGGQRCVTRQVHAGGAGCQHGADHHIFHLAALDTGPQHRLCDDMAQHGGRLGVVQ